ncbi:hypothetical protein KNE206_77800 [Kitasatospora sp. NE20-6]|uniref:terpene synthase family protein n=1 Tax=Kitasatospora sp. NE20-6 TaxID=2859066 RepID=UPI0034DBAFCD
MNQIPELYCPFPRATHPAAREFEEGTIAWLRRFGFVSTAEEEQAARQARFGFLTAAVYPTGRFEALQLASDLMVWLFRTDDSHIEEAGADRRLRVVADHVIGSLRILRDPDDLPPTPSREQLALSDISRRLNSLARPEQLERFICGMTEYFMAASCEAIQLAERSSPTLADYMALRESSICMRSVCFVFAEIAGGYELPGAAWCRPDLQAVVRSANRLIAMHHDVLSGYRELDRDAALNLPIALMTEHGLPPAVAFTTAARLADEEMRRFIALVDQLLSTRAGSEVDRYVESLRAWIAGNIDWSLETGRYHVDDYRAA